MKSSSVGTSTSEVEILNVSRNGVWLYAKGKEYFLPYAEYPWFEAASISELQRVRMLRGQHLRWDDLDVDLDLESLQFPERYPLKYRS